MKQPKRLDWDSDFFGLAVAAVDGPVDGRDSSLLSEFLSRERIQLCYWFGAASDGPSAGQVERLGFRYVDTRLTLRMPADAVEMDRTVVTGYPEHFDAVRHLAIGAFTGSRFFFDGGFPASKCDQLYDVWLRRSLERAIADQVLLCCVDGRTVGFVTIKVENECASIGLLSVAPEARGQGVGRRLVEAAKFHATSKGCTVVTVATQARNIEAQSLYVACGARPIAAIAIYHWWQGKDSPSGASEEPTP